MEKKTYIVPDMELITFEVEDIMMVSGVTGGISSIAVDWSSSDTSINSGWTTKSYNEL